MVDSRVGPSRNELCARCGHDTATVRFLDGIRFPSTAGARLTPERWREPNVRMYPTLRIGIDRRNS